MTTPATPGAPRAAELATQVETANQQLIDVVGGCSNEDWQQRSASEGWSVGVLAHHVAVSYGPLAEMVRAVANGQDPAVPSPEGQAAINARHAGENARVGKQETLDVLRRNGIAAAEVVRGLSDAQLARTTTAFGGRELNVAQLVEGAVIGHPRQHLASIRTALAS